MIALKQIQPVLNKTITIQLPIEFEKYQEVEVIILPIEKNHSESQTNTESFIARFAGSIPDFPEIDKLAPEIRNEL